MIHPESIQVVCEETSSFWNHQLALIETIPDNDNFKLEQCQKIQDIQSCLRIRDIKNGVEAMIEFYPERMSFHEEKRRADVNRTQNEIVCLVNCSLVNG
ncbi:hypothetical protein CEXT_125811 [Caerostris extrusa]|uniref:Uncharacterized protein n=1 Tax=Caerostris extrusa TaxID=172846 RepID=A0AAV4QMT7_CAEEX|nr:hypothetical protein CEXT_125811 [Caerostris extrusa]